MKIKEAESISSKILQTFHLLVLEVADSYLHLQVHQVIIKAQVLQDI